MTLQGKGVSPGFAVGPVYLYLPVSYETASGIELGAAGVPNIIPPGGREAELERCRAVKRQALEEVEKIRAAVEKHDPLQAKIFAAHKDIIEDPAIDEEITGKVLNEGKSGGEALFDAYEQFIRLVKRARDPLIAERAADFEDVRRRLLALWHGRSGAGLSSLEEPAIIAARDLLPSDTASLDRDKVLAVLTETGGTTSHSALIARSFGIPAVLGIPRLMESLRAGQTAAVDADSGTVLLDPPPAEAAAYAQKGAAFRLEREKAESFRNRTCRTADGVRIDIGVNIAGAESRELAEADFADSVGLFRTEFLYMGCASLPGEDEQYGIYRNVLEHFGSRPVILRTLDIGGDKPLSSMALPKEDNPFLGSRALRLCFSRPGLFKTQLRASLRAAVHGNLWIMFPMVASLDDIYRAQDYVDECKRELEREGRPFGSVKTGIMIEIPSIALVADHAAAAVDFASIGTNDLCQYLCAADRMNSAVADYYQSCHPGLFRLIGQTAEIFNAAGKALSVCGELGGDPLAAPVLVGLGIRKLSMGPAQAAKVKQVLSSLTVEQMEETARKALCCKTAGEVEQYLKKVVKYGSPC